MVGVGFWVSVGVWLGMEWCVGLFGLSLLGLEFIGRKGGRERRKA